MEQTEIPDPPRARIVPYTPLAGIAAIPEHIHRPPHLAVRLAPPPEAEPLLHAPVDDLAALRAQADADYAARRGAIEREYRAGDMAPNQRTAALNRADEERATHLERIATQMADLHPDALVERARHAAEEAMTTSWRGTLATWNRQHTTR